MQGRAIEGNFQLSNQNQALGLNLSPLAKIYLATWKSRRNPNSRLWPE
jgi:hypothetical protein